MKREIIANIDDSAADELLINLLALALPYIEDAADSDDTLSESGRALTENIEHV